MVDSGKIPHAILFHEEDGGGAFPLCMAFLQYLYCKTRRSSLSAEADTGLFETAGQSNGDSCGVCPECNRISKLIHADLHFVFPASAARPSSQLIQEFCALALTRPDFREAELNAALKLDGKNTMITVADSKQLLSELSLTALQGGYRSVIIYLPEKMNAEAANKLLKIIEEPPGQTLFLLIAHKPEKMLQTVASRCLRLRVRPSSAETDNSEPEESELFFELLDSLVSRDLLSCIESGEKIAAIDSREGVKAFLKYAADNIRLIFLAQHGLGSRVPERLSRYASDLPETFPEKAVGVLDRAVTLTDRNVNLKLLLTDMADRLYILI